MSFTKKRLKSQKPSVQGTFTDAKAAYFALKRKNRVFALALGVFAAFLMGFIGLLAFAQVSGFQISLPSVPDFVRDHMPFSTPKSEGPEKMNILLTGVGGEGHEGTDLTDTIILASVNRKTETVTMLSIPRDLYVEFPTRGRGKINETYMRAMKNADVETGMRALAEKVTEITGEPVDAYFNIDFKGFSKFVDVLGGITVDVPEDLVDTSYPDSNWGYQTFRIKKGLQLLDGDTALKYARSRHSTSDFDRSRRQQLVLKAIKEKLISMDALTSPTKIQALYYAITDHVKTNLSMSQMFSLALFAKGLPSDHILPFNLNDSCIQSESLCDVGSFLYTPPRDDFGGAWVLLPDDASANRISAYKSIGIFSNLIFNYPKIYLDRDEVYVVNSTKNSGLANRVALKLKRFGFNVPEKGSVLSTKDPYPETKVYYVHDSVAGTGIADDSETLGGLSFFLPVQAESVPESKYVKLLGPRIEIVLGSDATKLIQ